MTTHAMSVKEVADLKLATRRYKRARAQRRYHKKNAVAAGTSYGRHVTHVYNFTPLATMQSRALTPSFTRRGFLLRVASDLVRSLPRDGGIVGGTSVYSMTHHYHTTL